MSGKKQPKDPSPTDHWAHWTPAVYIDKVLPPCAVGVSDGQPRAVWRMDPAEEAEFRIRPGSGHKFQYLEGFKLGERLVGYVLEAAWGTRKRTVGELLGTEGSSDSNSASRGQSAWPSDLVRLRLFHRARPQVYWEWYPWERITLHGAEQVKRLGDLQELVSLLKEFRHIKAVGRPPLISQDTRTQRELVRRGKELKADNPQWAWERVLEEMQGREVPGSFISGTTFARYRKRFAVT